MFGENIQSTLVSLASRQGLDILANARAFQGTIEGEGHNLSLVVAGTKVPLPENTTLVAGQNVRVDVVDTGQGVQLRITPGEQPATPTMATQSAPLADFAARVFASFGASLSVEDIPQLIPPGAAGSEAAIRAAASSFTTSGTLGQDLQQLAQILTQPMAASILPRELAREVAALLSRVLVSNPDDLLGLLQQSVDGATRTIESRVAALMAVGKGVNLTELAQSDLRGVMSRLRNYEPLVEHLRQTGQWRSFDDTAQRVVDRMSSTQLQNLRGIEQPYLFLEVPVAAESGLHHVQVHFLGDGRGRRNQFDTKNVMVALDVSTAHLGDLWVTLQSSGGHCVCRFRATNEETVDAIGNTASELESALERIGFDRPVVHVALWDGNRAQEVARLLRPFSGIDVSA